MTHVVFVSSIVSFVIVLAFGCKQQLQSSKVVQYTADSFSVCIEQYRRSVQGHPIVFCRYAPFYQMFLDLSNWSDDKLYVARDQRTNRKVYELIRGMNLYLASCLLTKMRLKKKKNRFVFISIEQINAAHKEYLDHLLSQFFLLEKVIFFIDQLLFAFFYSLMRISHFLPLLSGVWLLCSKKKLQFSFIKC